MATLKFLVLGVFAFIAFVGLFTVAMVRGDEVSRSPTIQHDPAPYSARGPHWVGIRDLVIEGDRPLDITVWYPAARATSAAKAISYPYEIKMFSPLGKVAIAAFEGQAVRDAPTDLSAGPYPLLVLSPGFAIGSKTYAWLAEHLASYGFVVIAPDHGEELDPSLLWRSTIQRQRDILNVLSFVGEQLETRGAFEGLIDTERTAVAGHSYGGYTALAAGGARLDTDSLATSCQTAYETNDPVVFLCDALLPHVVEMAKLAGLDSAPKGLWPLLGDYPVRAVISMAGDAVVFGPAGLAEITVPVMAIGGTADKDSPYMWAAHPTYENVSSQRKVRIALIDAAHMIFTGPCTSVRGIVKLIPNEFCADPAWDKYDAHDLIKHFTTAFLLAELKQDKAAAAALTPDAVRFSGLTYDAQGYAVDSTLP